jgi:protocatechuate 3,4-dioxygenase beta subunit
MAPLESLRQRITRRQLLGIAGAAAAAVVAGCDDDTKPAARPAATGEATVLADASPTLSAVSTPEPSALSCIVSPEMIEGPFFVDEMLERSDITTDPGDGSASAGTPLDLTLNIYRVNGNACAPLSGALVDIWHCDAVGLYSDVAANGTAGRRFLRGYQRTDENGEVRFQTIYPGWYMGRAVHIHVKVRTDPEADQGLEFTSQIFFDDALTTQVYTQEPYAGRGSPDTPNSADGIYQGGGSQMVLPAVRTNGGYAGALSIGVRVA